MYMNWMHKCAAAAVTMLAVLAASAQQGADEPADLYRPAYHFTPPKNWMNDPNGLVYFDGEYHLFYQYNPEGINWGHMSWGHAVSRDLVRWEHLPVAIPEADGVMAFSGSAVVDMANTSGFGKDGKPPMVAIYTGHRPSDGNQSQCLAFSNDRGRTWTRYEKNPVIDIGSNNFRDPKVSWFEQWKCWVMVVSMSEERKVRFYRSTDLKAWELLSEFGGAGCTAGVWECPDLFELRTEDGTRSRWVLIVNVGGGGPQGGNGCQYFVGEFDGTRFGLDEAWKQEEPAWLDRGRDFYAAVTWSGVPVRAGDREARRILLGWMVNGEYAGSTPTTPWRSAMTAPRLLSLHMTDGGPRVFQLPVQELEMLRGRRCDPGKGSVEDVNKRLKQMNAQGKTLDLETTFRAGSAKKFGVKVRVGEAEETVIGYDVVEQRVFVDRRKSGNVAFHGGFAGVHGAPAKLQQGEIKLRVLVDVSSVEVFVNSGEVVLTELIYPRAQSTDVEMWDEGGEAEVLSLMSWEMNEAKAPGK